MKNYIDRNIYLEKIIPFIDKNIVKVIVGQRRVGKSYFLLQIMDHLRKEKQNPNIIFINKELYEFDFIRDYHDLMKYVRSKTSATQQNYLFVDEIQDIDQFEKALRSLQAEGNFDIFCTGSNAKMLSGDLATLLSGRYIETKIFSLSYPEFLEFHNLENSQQAFFDYIKFGGLPYLIHLTLEERVVFDYVKNVYDTIVLKDVVSRYQVRNVAFLENLILFLADNIGNLLSAKKISDFLKSQRIQMSPNLILSYCNYMASAFFIFKVKRSDISGKKIFDVGEKYYFEDVGMRHALIGFRQKDINQILENVVFTHLLICGYSVTVGKTDGKEIDFICQKNGEKLYVQVAYLIPDQKVREREFGNLLAVKDNFPKLVVSMDEMAGGQYEGISHLHVRDFLSKYW
ncbi:MAG: ATP-binding protein [Calditrichaeota bacterium]|nr:ATP-binding protein [Calditrichota bacterium]